LGTRNREHAFVSGLSGKGEELDNGRAWVIGIRDAVGKGRFVRPRVSSCILVVVKRRALVNTGLTVAVKETMESEAVKAGIVAMVKTAGNAREGR